MSVIISPLSPSLLEFLERKKYSKIFVLVDTNTKKHCYPAVKKILPKHTLLVVKAGETHKNLTTCTQIWAAMTHASLDRHALVINLGGGVLGDMGGFCAATYKRGVDFVQVPTTLLSQVDASVGGKLGIDFEGFKNHIGVFTQPQAVLIDQSFLATLPYLELRSGFAEVIKHCLIADVDKWDDIRTKDLEQQNWGDLIAHSVAIKQKIVAQDPTEQGLRKILNFGHSIGHALETHLLDQPKRRILHGEAVAAGMVMEAYLSFRKKMIDAQTLDQIEEFIFSVYGRVEIADSEFDTILQLAYQDKKNKDGQLRFSLLDQSVGHCTFDVAVSASEFTKALQYYHG